VWLYVANFLASERKEEIARVYHDNDAMARTFEEHVRRVLQSADGTLLYLKHEFEESGTVGGEFTDILEEVRHDPAFNQITVADARGDLVASAVPHSGTINVAAREEFQQLAAGKGRGMLIGTPRVTRLSGSWSIFLSRRLDKPDGSFAGIVSLGLDPAYFSKFYDEVELGPARAVLLVGRDGIVRARRFQDQTEIGQDLRKSPMFARLASEPVGHHEVVGVIDQRRRFASYRAMPDFPLIVAVSDLASSALAAFERRRTAYLASAFVFTLFVGAFCAALIAAGRRERRQSAQLSAELAERRRAEEALREASDRYRDLFENASDAIFLLDERHRYADVNRRAVELFGFAREEFLGRPVLEFVPPEQAPRSEAAFRELRERGEYGGFAGRMRTKDGRWLDVEVSSSAIVRDGAFAGSRDIVRDVTERHLLEEARLKSEKLESIGTLAGGIAHDFNNLLQGVFGYISMARMSIDQREKALAMIEQAERALHQSVSLTTQLLTFSKGGRPVRERMLLAPVVETAVKFALSGSRTGCRLCLEPGLWPVDADAGQIAQVVQNVVINADQAMPQGGLVEVTARNVAPGDPALPPDLPRRCHVMIAIRDTGVGIPHQDLDRIFYPYYTTKEKGSGLGLATSYSIVRNHEGRISARSEPGAGTTFEIFLPASEAAVAAASPAVAPAAVPTGAPRSARILVMDDEAIIRNVAGELLQALGHSTAFADRGEAAIEAYRAARDAGRCFDLVILDLTIRGGMGGVEAAARLREIDPGVKIVASSGYSDEASLSGYRGQGFAAFLRKPYNLQRLRETLDALLASGRSPGNE
jgi:PAS domain S-box-containing protein